MASATLMLSFSLRLPSSFSSPSSVRVPNEVVQFSPFSRACSLKLSSSRNISGFAPILPLRHSTLNSPSPSQPSSLTVVSAKGYKMKTHKVCFSKAISGNGSWKDSAEESREAAFAGKEECKEEIASLKNGGLSLNPWF
ncbi:hypothetical protein CK203_038709 [Vitis vinifera]|uniref:Uncharacterized protein n=1 Tax=Vitis vinifera TaxID=29760 RepID=A0A438DFG7_VITVI|nr:hypothetical protein CK203_102199 [Vitis vinifera]RVW88266.1 hypothetical protein CK203_038709 [Vitis vinifera]